ncbi:MAG: zf-HC2 domain-containing protein [Armatimonadetes bacterium]|nr:zf-HC2 domain-containing protein [Armatimonadota bacterium]
MNCHSANRLLSAYIDRELSADEMRAVRVHVEQCDDCRDECEDLLFTKRMLSGLSSSAPRAELESLLVVRAKRVQNPSLFERVMPPEWSDAMLWRWEGVGNLASPRLRPLVATALFSLAGLCLATASVNRPADESPFGDAPTGQTFAVYVGSTGTLTRVPLMPEMRDNRFHSDSGMMPVSLAPENVSGTWHMATPSLPATVRRDSGFPANWENELIPAANPRRASFSFVIISRQP